MLLMFPRRRTWRRWIGRTEARRAAHGILEAFVLLLSFLLMPFGVFFDESINDAARAS